MTRSRSGLLSLATALVALNAASAQLITGVTATATSELFEGPFDRRAIHAADGSGLDMAGVNHGIGEGTVWETDNNPRDTDPAITFDLGGLYSLGMMRVWNFPESQPAVRRADIQISLDGSMFTSIGERTFALPTNPSQDFSLGNVPARFVRFDILENGGGAQFPGGQAFVGLAEVRFFGLLVPEPGTMAFALLACAFLAMCRFRSS
jgi:hypothetical protein